MTGFKNNFSVGRMQELLPQTLLFPSGPTMSHVSTGAALTRQYCLPRHIKPALQI